MDTSVYYIIGAFFVFQFIILIFYSINKKKKRKAKQNADYDRLLSIYSNPETVKIALWIDINYVNGQPFDESCVYTARVKSNMTGMNTNVDVALFKPGIYDFVISSREYKNVNVQVELEQGKTYQFGADEDGPYIIPDPDPARYELKKTD